MKILTHLDLNQNELRNAVLQPLASAPDNPKLGQFYFNSTSKKIEFWNGANWQDVGAKIESSEKNGYVKINGVEVKIYELPIASADILGGFKVGSGLTINPETGVLSATGGGTADSVDWQNITSKPTFSAVATSGSYNDLSDTPTIPVNLSDLTNDTNFIDNTVNNLTNYYLKEQTYSKEEVNALASTFSKLKIEVVDALPEGADISDTTIYLLPRENKWEQDAYDEYIYVSSKWEKIGQTTIDLSNYLQKNSDASGVTVAFEVASERALPATGETLAIIAGKITKYLTDLHTVAFSGSYNDLTNKPAQLTIEQLVLTAGQTTATTLTTFENSVISSVFARDAVTNEMVIVDWKLSEKKIVASIAEAYANDIEINISYLK